MLRTALIKSGPTVAKSIARSPSLRRAGIRLLLALLSQLEREEEQSLRSTGWTDLDIEVERRSDNRLARETLEQWRRLIK